MSERDPQDRDPFDNLRDLIDEPVSPRESFAAELRSRLMSDLSASDGSREEQRTSMDGAIELRPMPRIALERPRHIRPMAILELAAVAVIILGLAAAIGRGAWFGNDPETPTSLPAAALQGDGTPTSEQESNATPTPETVLEPTVVPPGDIPGSIWVLPGVEGGSFDFGGMLVEDGVVYRLIATSDFVGIQAIDGRTGVAKWQQAQRWAGDFFAIEDDTLYFGGGDNTLAAVDAETGERHRTMDVPGNPIAMTADDDRIFVLLDSDMIVALDEQTGAQLWVAQGRAPQNPTGGSTSMLAIGKIDEENGVVVAVSTYGVLSGFDAETGEELWAHEGFDAASVTIESEDGQLVVASGYGSMSVSVRVGDSDDDAIANVSNGDNGCLPYFEATPGSVSTASGAEGTPLAGTGWPRVAGETFRVQALDPRTGDIIWEQQLISSDKLAIADAQNAANPVMCAVDAKTGEVSETYFSSDDFVSIGTIPDGGGGAQPVITEDGTVVTVFGVTDGREQPIAAAIEDDAVYLQLAGGSLVKVAANGVAGDDDHHENREDDSDDTPEADDD